MSQTLLKLASPGVPDTYQGTELWDFSLVDPDNRRPVDYGRRREMLESLKDRMSGDLRELARELVGAKEDGRIKLYVTHSPCSAAARTPDCSRTGHMRRWKRRGRGGTTFSASPATRTAAGRRRLHRGS